MANQAQRDKTSFSVGDSVAVYQEIQEGDKTRVQTFRGVVIAIRGQGENKSFTVRRIAAGGIGAERIWPLNSPWINKIEVLKKGQVRRAKLYYLRRKVGRRATRIKEKKTQKSDDRVKRGRNHVERDENQKPRPTRRKARPKTSPK